LKKTCSTINPATHLRNLQWGIQLCLLSIRASEILEKATELFAKSYKPNEMPPFGVLSETAGGTNRYFATGAGGFLQAVMNGFGGLTISDAGITQIKTKIPKNWKSLFIRGVGKDRVDFKSQID
jgi:hypothetical protein